MKISDLKNLELPKRKDEEFRKIDFSKLFSYEFKQVKNYVLDIPNCEVLKNDKIYEDVLFNLTKSLDEKQYILNIKENTKKPIIIIHKINEDETFYTNSLEIKLEKNIKASILELFVSNCENSAYSVNRDFIIGENSSLEYIKLQDINQNNSFLYNSSFEQKKSSKCNFSNFELGEGFSVNSYINEIKQLDVKYNLNALVKSKNSANTSSIAKTVHHTEGSTSDINFKHTLKDSAKAVFKATSIVKEEALFTKAFQNSNTILLSNDAVIYAQPHLEIFIDELEASHGATTGTLDKNQLLYLQARGIKEEKAYDMLLDAFESQIYEDIENEDLKEFINNYKRENYV